MRGRDAVIGLVNSPAMATHRRILPPNITRERLISHRYSGVGDDTQAGQYPRVLSGGSSREISLPPASPTGGPHKEVGS